MARIKKTLFAGSVLLGLEVLSLAVFIAGSFAWSHRHVPALLSAITPVDATPVRLHSPAKRDGGIVLEKDGETAPDSGCLFAATESARLFFRSPAAVPACLRTIFTPKVSRFISKSVLNL